MPGLGLGLAPALERLWEEQGGRRAVEGLLQHIVTLLLKHLTIAHDLLLSLPAFRRAALFAFGARHRAIVEGALSPPPAAPTSWEALEYWIDPQSRQLLQFVALAALSTHLAADEVLAPAQLLPQVSRALLQTVRRSGQEHACTPCSAVLRVLAAAQALPWRASHQIRCLCRRRRQRAGT